MSGHANPTLRRWASVAALLASHPLRPAAWLRAARDAAVVRASDLFEFAWYMEQYPDVADGRLDPALHYIRYGASEGRDPGPRFSTGGYLELNPDVSALGLNPLVHYERFGRVEGRSWRGAQSKPPGERAHGRRLPVPVVSTVRLGRAERRVTLVMEGIADGCVLGGPDIDIVVAALLAARLECRLRLVTLIDEPRRSLVADVLRYHGVEWGGGIEFLHAGPEAASARVDVSAADIFISTSWWTTRCVRPVAPPGSLVYLVQDDEGSLAPTADEALRAREALSDPGVRYLVCSGVLMEHLAGRGHTSLATHGVSFEPAFPLRQRVATGRVDGRHRLLFHAQPNRPDGLFYRGLEALDGALRRQVLDPEAWALLFVGPETVPVTLPLGVAPTWVPDVPLAERAARLADADVALSLGYGPRPTYQAMEWAAQEIPVVASWLGDGGSTIPHLPSLTRVEPEVSSIIDGLRCAVTMAFGDPPSGADASSASLERSWHAALAPALGWLAGELS